MKKALYVLLVGIFTFGLVPQVLAQENLDTPEQSETTIEPNEEVTTQVLESPGNSGDNGNNAERRAERIERYRAKIEERLSFAEQNRIKGACRGAQAVSLRLVQNVQQVKENRERAYTSITEKLTSLVSKLEAAGVDATDLESAVESMEGEVTIFLASVGDYETILNDLSLLDCEEDPAAFKAALESAKEQRVVLVSSSQNLRKYFNDSIKPVLLELRQTLTSDDEGDN